MESLLPLIIQLVSGAVGGNVAGSLLKDQSLALSAIPLQVYWAVG